MTEEYPNPDGPVIRDKRRIDPETGQVREPRESVAPGPAGQTDGVQTQAPAGDPTAGDPGSVGPESGSGDAASTEAETALAERTADLQRLQAEYVNYKRRVDRDRLATREATVASVLTSLLPVLDDIGRAREHEELAGGFKAVAESLERTVTALGLVTFGEVGDPFDPRIHEALMHTYSDEVSGPVCQLVLQVGYRLGDRIVRPARVAVAEPGDTSDETAASTFEAESAGADGAEAKVTTPEQGDDSAEA